MTSRKQFKGLILIFIFGVIVFSGCSTAAEPTQTPTVDPVSITETIAVIQTSAVETAQAQITQTAMSAPTDTPLPPTATPLPPTMTPTITQTGSPTASVSRTPLIPVVQPTRTLAPQLQPTTSSQNISYFDCQIISQLPAYKAQMKPGEDFDGRWTLKNTGSSTWKSDEVDFQYLRGYTFQKHGDYIDLPKDVRTGNEISIIIDMTAPQESGNFSAIWGLMNGSKMLCAVEVNIQVSP